MRNYLFVSIMMFLLFISCSDDNDSVESKYPDLTVYEFDATKELVKFVYDASVEFELKGEAVFTEFEDVPWFAGERYVFVLNTDGILLFNPTNTENVGKDIIGLKDKWGKPFIQEMIDHCNNNGGEGWTHYQWIIPRTEEVNWKTSFIKKITRNGKDYIIGSGIYLMPMEKVFVTEKVDEACDLIEKGKDAAFAAIRDTTDCFIFKDSYVFVISTDGTTLVNPMYKEDEGKNMMEKQDSNGKYFIKEMIDLANKSGKGWVTYSLPREAGMDPEEKHTYIMKIEVEGESLIVGSGMYYDNYED
jgi:signal transduction histidine kinase